MLESVLIGMFLVGLTVVVHAVGTTYWLRFTVRSLSSKVTGLQLWWPSPGDGHLKGRLSTVGCDPAATDLLT